LVNDLVQRGVDTRRAQQFIAASEPLSAVLGSDWAKPVRLKAAGSPNDASGQHDETKDALPRKPVPGPHRENGVNLDRVRAKHELLARLNAVEPYEFEQLVGRVLDSIGFKDTQVVGKSGDEGVDIITYLHSPLITAKVAVQVKRRSGNVGPKDISYLRSMEQTIGPTPVHNDFGFHCRRAGGCCGGTRSSGDPRER
jgi:hypothetical protein